MALGVILALVAAGGFGSPEHAEAALIEVNSLADDDDGACNLPGLGVDCTLREAINRANQLTGLDEIRFNVGIGNPQIDVATPLPPITSPVTISGNTNGATRVVLHFSGSNSPQLLENGLDMAAASTVRFMVIQGFDRGIFVRASGSELLGNRIGTSADGMTAMGNRTGIDVSDDVQGSVGGVNGTTPGGGCTGDCNLISGNDIGIAITVPNQASRSTLIVGNFIGTNAAGTAALPNGQGINAYHAFDNSHLQIGTLSPLGRNVISGNTQEGITATATTEILGNFIGTDTTGMQPLGNGGRGIDIHNYPADIQRNVVSANGGGGGIVFGQSGGHNIEGNKIGTAVDGITPMGNFGAGIGLVALFDDVTVGDENIIAFNTLYGVYVGGAGGVEITQNSIHDNGDEGIHLESGTNGGILPPVITQVTAVSVSGTTCNNCAVEVFSDGADEGETFEASTFANGSGQWTVNASVAGPNVTATTTGTEGTSEFSAVFSLSTPTPTPTPSPTPTPTLTSTVTPTVTPTGSASMTPTATPTGSASVTPTATASGEIAWGDHNCSGTVDTEDALLALAHAANLETDTGDCPEMGEPVDVENASIHAWGDVDCSDEVDAGDALELFAYAAGIEVSQPGSCPDVGDERLITP